MEHLIIVGYSTSYFFYSLTLITYLLSWRNPWQYLSIIAVTVNFLVLMHIAVSSGHFPFFNVFECLLSVTFILGGLGVLCNQTEKHRLDVRSWVWIEIIFLLEWSELWLTFIHGVSSFGLICFSGLFKSKDTLFYLIMQSTTFEYNSSRNSQSLKNQSRIYK